MDPLIYYFLFTLDCYDIEIVSFYDFKNEGL